MNEDSTLARRFMSIQAEGRWTVWDSKEGQRIIHEARWTAEVAQRIADSLNARPYHAETAEWKWAPWTA